MRPNAASYRVIGAAMKVHTALGPGILESAYDACLCYEFARWGLHFQHQVKLPITLPVHRAQLLSYLRLTGHKLGLLMNFNVPHLREGIHRIINGPEEEL